jgi:hypothetical protein
MKFNTHKNWATVLCAAAVFSLVTMGNARAGSVLNPGILPPPPISSPDDGVLPSPGILPPPPVTEDLTGGEQLIGDFSGVLMID